MSADCFTSRRHRSVLFRSAIFFLLLGAATAGGGADLAVAAPAAAGAWSPPLNLSQTAGRTYVPLLQEEPRSGDLFVVWTDYSAEPNGDILLRRRIGATGVWTDTLNLSDSPARDEGPALFADPQGRVHLAWTWRQSGVGTDILYRRWEGGIWSAIQVLDHTDTYDPSPYGLLFIQNSAGRTCLFVNLGSGMRTACLEETGWPPLSPWVYVSGMRSLGALVLGPDGLFHAAVLGNNVGGYYGCDPWLDDVYYATYDGTTWAVRDNLSAPDQHSIAYDTALAFDHRGRLHLFWSDISPFCSFDSDHSAVYERVLDEGVWGPLQEVSIREADQAVQDLALAGDAAGWLYLAWSEGVFDEQGVAQDLVIHYRRWNGLAWGEEEIVDAPSTQSMRVDLAVGRRGVVRAVWEEGATWQEEVYFSEREAEQRMVFLPLVLFGRGM